MGGKTLASENAVHYWAGVNPPFFSYDNLRSLFARVRALGWAGPLRDWLGQNGTIMRHDVDLSIQRAHDMAVLEKECGIRSSFFILTTNCVYNPMTARHRALLGEMAQEGFEIGLHFDPTVYGDASDQKLADHARREADQLSDAAGTPVASLSIHCPSVHGLMPLIEGFVNAYDPKVFQAERYWSDSCMSPRKELWPVVEMAASGLVQVLIHPFHFSAHGCGYEKLIPDHVGSMLDELDHTFRRDNHLYRKVFPRPLGQYLPLQDPGADQSVRDTAPMEA